MQTELCMKIQKRHFWCFSNNLYVFHWSFLSLQTFTLLLLLSVLICGDEAAVEALAKANKNKEAV